MARSKSRSIAAVVLLGGVVFLALGGVVGAILDDAPRKPTTSTVAVSSTTSTSLAPLGDLGEVGEELDALIAAGRQVDHHAVYGVTDAKLPEGLVQTLEIWRKGEDFRSDIVERQGNGVRRQSTTVGASSATFCETVNGEQTCRVATAAPSDLSAAFVRALVTNGTLNDEDDPQVPASPLPELEVSEGDVAGFVARCFAYTDGDEDGELCLAEDGVMLSVRLQGATILATTLEDVVPDSAFDHPGVVRDDD